MSDPLACAHECPFTREGHSDADHDYVAAPPSGPAAPLREAAREVLRQFGPEGLDRLSNSSCGSVLAAALTLAPKEADHA